jgi:acetyltransferase-like isoleucine patch superfamily enzyme
VSIFRQLTKYPFASTLLIVRDILATTISTPISTAKTKLILSALGCRYGKNLEIDGKLIIRIHRRGAIRLGDNVRVKSRFMSNPVGMTSPTVFHCIGDGSIKFGDNSGCSAAVLSSQSGIDIGDNVNMGANVRVFDHDFHSIDFLARRDPTADRASRRTMPIVIGNDVFIGTNAIILKGVTIGDRCVIGAGAVVALKDIPPDSLVLGNPAKVVKSLSASTHTTLSDSQ